MQKDACRPKFVFYVESAQDDVDPESYHFWLGQQEHDSERLVCLTYWATIATTEPAAEVATVVEWAQFRRDLRAPKPAQRLLSALSYY